MTRLPRFIPTSLIALSLLLGAAMAQYQPAAQPATSEKTTQQAAPDKAASPQTPGQEPKQASEHAAAGEEHEGHAEFKQSASVKLLARITGLDLNQAYWLAIIINFLVIAAAIAWFAKSSLPAMFRARTESIRKTMDEAQRTSADAARRLSDIESRLSRLDGELAQMRSSAEAEAAAEEERIRAAAAEDARKIEEAIGQEIAAATRLAQHELKAYAAELAVSLAEKRIQVDPSTDRALVENFVGQLGKSGNGKEGK
jgi:F-type H+-transporting ATPase subunit b